jgi:hypothetical protein
MELADIHELIEKSIVNRSDERTLKERIIRDKWNVVSILYACKDGRWDICSELKARDRDARVFLVLQKPIVRCSRK